MTPVARILLLTVCGAVLACSFCLCHFRPASTLLRDDELSEAIGGDGNICLADSSCKDGSTYSKTIDECAHPATNSSEPAVCETDHCLETVIETATCKWADVGASCETKDDPDGKSVAYQTARSTSECAADSKGGQWQNFFILYKGCGADCGNETHHNVYRKACVTSGCAGTDDPNYVNVPRGGPKQKLGCS